MLWCRRVGKHIYVEGQIRFGKDSLIPLEDSSIPVEDFTIPLEDSSIPVEDFTIPLEDSSIPVEDFIISLEDSSMPVEDFTIPLEGYTMPVRDFVISLDDYSILLEDMAIPLEDIINSLEDRAILTDENTLIHMDSPYANKKTASTMRCAVLRSFAVPTSLGAVYSVFKLFHESDYLFYGHSRILCSLINRYILSLF